MGSVQDLASQVTGWEELEASELPLQWVDPMASPRAIASAPPIVGETPQLQFAKRPLALVMDDGELSDIEHALEELGATTLRLIGPTTARPWHQPKRLLVISARRALSIGPPVAQEEDHFFTMVVFQKPSRTLLSRLAQLGFDYAVQRPVDPEALQLLLRNALYRGREHVLAEFSQSGCSLRMSSVGKTCRRIKVQLPGLLAGGEPLTLHGAVVRSERIPGESDSKIVSVMFECRADTCHSIATILDELRTGPPALTQ